MSYNKTGMIIISVVMLAAGFFGGQWSGRRLAEKTVVATQQPCPGPVLLQDRVVISRKKDPQSGKVTETRVITPQIISVPTNRGQGTPEPKLVIQTKYRLGVQYVPSVSLTKPAGGFVGLRAGSLPVWVDLGYTVTVGPTVGLSYEW